MKIPEWLKFAATDSMLSAQDVMQIFGYEIGSSTFYSHIETGKLPPPDHRQKREGKTSKLFWNAKTIRNEIRRRNIKETA